jgi:hypothetical protein
LTYWGDSVDQVLLDQLARDAQLGASAALVPTLYPLQGILTTNRALAQRDIILKDEDAGMHAEWLVLSRRTAYWRPEIRDRLRRGDGQRVATRSRQGIWLSALWHFPLRQPRPAASAFPLKSLQPRIGFPAELETGKRLPQKDVRNSFPSH